jgi:hypothetical protein
MASALGVYFVLLFGHFLGDYVFQSRLQSLHKGHNLGALLLHVASYAGIMTAAFWVGVVTMQVTMPFLLYSAIVFFVAVFATHFVVDFLATRVYNYLWTEHKYKAFFSVVGFEQLLHQYVLLIATIWLVGF